MSVTLVDNVARPLATTLCLAFSADTYGKLDGYGILGVTDPDAVIKALFANSEQGAVYDRSDLTTMFQNSAGTTPVTADGQTVGLILDKSKGLVLGPELVITPYSGFPTTGWTINPASVVNDGSAVGNCRIDLTLSSSIKKVTLTASNVTGGTYFLNFPGISPAYSQIGANGNYSFIVKTYTDTELFLQPYEGTPGTITITNISIKELAGNHAVAPSNAARPLKTSTSAADWINYDAVDDVLNSTFPSSLGSSCTVARANVGAAPTILTAQTIGTSYADSTDNAALIIINRALTAQETTDVTAWLLAKGATS